MAQKVEVVLTCDLDAGDTPAVETVAFSYDGQTYEFELCQDHLDQFRQVLQGFADAARRVTGGRQAASARGNRRSGNSSELAVIREWARNHGFEVSDRGRISAEVRQAFDAAQR